MYGLVLQGHNRLETYMLMCRVFVGYYEIATKSIGEKRICFHTRRLSLQYSITSSGDTPLGMSIDFI